MPEHECKCSGPEIDSAVIDRIINIDFSRNRENLIMMMQAIQKQYRYLPRPALDYLAGAISVPISKIYEIATFYASFSLEPKGKHILTVCTGTACHLKGTGKMVEHITAKTGIGPGKTTPDMKLTLETVNCVGACAVAPVLVIDEKYYPEATLSTVINFLDQVKAED
jgi:NADH:ubiquinone oxidoreductase subunit E